MVIKGFEPDPKIKAEPIKNGRSSAPRGVTFKPRMSKGRRISKSAPKKSTGSKHRY
jgi:ATP-dependent RNA helicase RhlE